MSSLFDVACIITCGPQYERWLPEAILSVQDQQRPASEIAVVCDRNPEAARIARRAGVRALSIDSGSVWQARRAGFEATSAPLVMFLDADDRLGETYIAAASQKAEYHPGASIVHSDWRRFGGQRTTFSKFPGQVNYESLWRSNSIHSASIVRRSAVVLTEAFRGEPEPQAHEDWLFWRRILSAGGHSIKSVGGLLHYREHPHSRSRERPADTPWSVLFNMRDETVPLLVPLSGRSWAWPKFSAWLESQTWPHDQIELRILDTSQSPEFSRTVRRWLADCDYPHAQYQAASVADPGLADRPRIGHEDVQREVNQVMRRIWSKLLSGVNSPFVVSLEDDIVPQVDAVSRMLMQFDSQTDVVACPYRHRLKPGQFIPPRPDNPQSPALAAWCAFGCTAWRTDGLRKMEHPSGSQWYDVGLSERLRCVCLWDSVAEHRDAPEIDRTESLQTSAEHVG